jgi:sugar/nucleoside kinase (ribokinase family)
MRKICTYDVAVVGHLCLDIIPTFKTGKVPLEELIVPGKLVDVGEMVLSTGGAANNVGLALHALGLGVRIAAKIGDDALGTVATSMLNAAGAELTADMIVEPGGMTSYSVVLNPPGIDRIFFHSPGANDTFRAADVADETLSRARHMHFGYPPLMRGFYSDGGEQLRELMLRARANGCSTSLDMARPDPDGDSGKVDWKQYLARTLPTVDFFLPSVDELVFMIDPARVAELLSTARGGNVADFMQFDEIGKYADILIGMGAALIGFKLGDRGFYVKASGDVQRLEAVPVFSRDTAAAWKGLELYAPCRQVKVEGTTGAGDCTIAGFLAAVLRGLEPEDVVDTAVSVGGASVEARGAVGGVPSWDALRARMASGWAWHSRTDIGSPWEKLDSGCFRKKE